MKIYNKLYCHRCIIIRLCFNLCSSSIISSIREGGMLCSGLLNDALFLIFPFDTVIFWQVFMSLFPLANLTVQVVYFWMVFFSIYFILKSWTKSFLVISFETRVIEISYSNKQSFKGTNFYLNFFSIVET